MNNLYKVVYTEAEQDLDTESLLISAKDLEECKGYALNHSWTCFNHNENKVRKAITNFTVDRLNQTDYTKPINIFLVENKPGILFISDK